MKGLRIAALAASLVLAVVTAGCRQQDRLEVQLTAAGEREIRLGVLPADDPGRMARALRPVLSHLSAALGRPVDLVVSPTHEMLGDLLDTGRVDLAWWSGAAHSRFAKSRNVTTLATVVRRGRTSSRGVLVVRAASGLRTVADLKGARFAYVDRNSGSGFVAANRLLIEAGLDPLADLGSLEFTHGHHQSLLGVLEGRYDAAAVHEGALEAHRDRMDTTRLRVLAYSGPLDPDVVVACRDLSVPLGRSIAAELCGLTRTPAGRAALAALHEHDPVDGFLAAGQQVGVSGQAPDTPGRSLPSDSTIP